MKRKLSALVDMMLKDARALISVFPHRSMVNAKRIVLLHVTMNMKWYVPEDSMPIFAQCLILASMLILMPKAKHFALLIAHQAKHYVTVALIALDIQWKTSVSHLSTHLIPIV